MVDSPPIENVGDRLQGVEEVHECFQGDFFGTSQD